MWEMPLLSCISELMHGLRGDFGRYDAALEERRAREKTVQILENGLILGDMGTRRRFSFAHHEMVIRVMKEVSASREWPGRFTGTSNVWLAMKYDCVPLGTMSHQLISFEENVSGVNECNFNVMKKFSDVYDGDNGLYLYDCFGDEVFFSNLSKRMDMMYKGLRVDSGDEFEQPEKIIAKYRSLGIDPPPSRCSTATDSTSTSASASVRLDQAAKVSDLLHRQPHRFTFNGFERI